MEEAIFTKRIYTGTRVYYIDVRADQKGQRFITLSEIPTKKHLPNQKKRKRIFLHQDYAAEILECLAEASANLKT